MNDQPPVPLDHPARRRILRSLHEVGGCATGDELSTGLRIELTEVTYHARVLVECRMLRERPGGKVLADTRFESTVADDPEVIVQLMSTEAEDEA